ncbi:MAG: hypothetical protein ACK5JH_00055 [Anaerocolumna sp.]
MKKNKNESIDFEKAFKGKKIPIIVLDERWHELFPDYDKPYKIRDIEVELNKLIKEQGKIATELKDLKQLKTKLMKEIIEHMDPSENDSGKLKAKKLDQNQKFIREISEKTKKMEDDLIELPYTIKKLNEKLIVESAIVCYNRLNDNKKRISEISNWVLSVREELKDKILEKQDMEMKNTAIYSYMHDIMGPELLQELDENLKN